MRKGAPPAADGESQIGEGDEDDEKASRRSEPSHTESAKSDSYLAFLGGFRPAIEVHTNDGRVYTVPFTELDQRLEAIRRGDI